MMERFLCCGFDHRQKLGDNLAEDVKERERTPNSLNDVSTTSREASPQNSGEAGDKDTKRFEEGNSQSTPPTTPPTLPAQPAKRPRRVVNSSSTRRHTSPVAPQATAQSLPDPSSPAARIPAGEVRGKTEKKGIFRRAEASSATPRHLTRHSRLSNLQSANFKFVETTGSAGETDQETPRWQVRIHHQWKDLPQTLNGRLERILGSPHEPERWLPYFEKSNKQNYSFSTWRMIQVNVKTKRERKIRRIPPAPNASSRSPPRSPGSNNAPFSLRSIGAVEPSKNICPMCNAEFSNHEQLLLHLVNSHTHKDGETKITPSRQSIQLDRGESTSHEDDNMFMENQLDGDSDLESEFTSLDFSGIGSWRVRDVSKWALKLGFSKEETSLIKRAQLDGRTLLQADVGFLEQRVKLPKETAVKLHTALRVLLATIDTIEKKDRGKKDFAPVLVTKPSRISSSPHIGHVIDLRVPSRTTKSMSDLGSTRGKRYSSRSRRSSTKKKSADPPSRRKSSRSSKRDGHRTSRSRRSSRHSRRSVRSTAPPATMHKADDRKKEDKTRYKGRPKLSPITMPSVEILEHLPRKKKTEFHLTDFDAKMSELPEEDLASPTTPSLKDSSPVATPRPTNPSEPVDSDDENGGLTSEALDAVAELPDVPALLNKALKTEGHGKTATVDTLPFQSI